MAPILRGEIRHILLEPAMVQGHEQGGDRPGLILSVDQFNATSKLAVVALIGSSEANIGRVHSYQIESVPMPKPSWVLTDQIRTLSEKRVGECYGKMSDEELLAVTQRIFRIIYAPPRAS